jgi:ribosome-associated translation inhibitor RaiA
VAKINVRNQHETYWTGVIETRISYMLASVMVNVKSLDVDFDMNRTYGNSDTRYRCKVRALDNSGLWHVASNEQMDPSEAIDGAIARVRRSIVRLRQYKQAS